MREGDGGMGEGRQGEREQENRVNDVSCREEAGAEITDQGVSKQLRCRQEVRPNSVRLEVTARRSQGLRPAAGCGRGSRLTGSALSPLANGRVATSSTGKRSSTTHSLLSS